MTWCHCRHVSEGALTRRCRVPGGRPVRCFDQSVGSSSPAPWVPCPLPHHVCGYAPPLLGSINHTTLQLWPPLTVNALCKSNQLSSTIPSSERKAGSRTQPMNTCFSCFVSGQITKQDVVHINAFSQILLLPAHCLVGELSHSVELLLHLVVFCVNTGR